MDSYQNGKNKKFKQHLSYNLKNYLKNIDTIALLCKISEFQKINIEESSEKKIRDSFYKTILSQENMAAFPTYIFNINKGEYIFRVRKLEEGDTIIPLKAMNSISDAWNPPEKYVKRPGRINKIGESLLYATLDNPNVLLKELKIQKNSFYSLIIYETKEVIKVNHIGKAHDFVDLDLDENEIIKLKIINNFISTEFTRDVREGNEYLYRVSEFLAKNFFDLPPRDVQDAWGFNSIVDKQAVNLCFRPDIAKEKLDLKGVLICKNKGVGKIETPIILLPNNETNLLDAYEFDEELRKFILPKLTWVFNKYEES